MHLTETTLDIIDHLGKSPFSGESIRSLANKLGKAYPLIHNHVTNLLEEGILIDKKIGRARHCTLNLGNPQSQMLLGYLNARTPIEDVKLLAKKLAAINIRIPILTACFLDDEVWIVTDNPEHKIALEQEFPFNGVSVLTSSQFKERLFSLAHSGLPIPLLHPSIFFDLLGMIQQVVQRWDA